jgi:hypothetical protein
LKIYTYDSPYLRVIYATFVIGIAGLSWVAYFVINGELSRNRAVSFEVWFMMCALPVVFTGGLMIYFFKARPIGLSEEGISNYLFWRRRKFIDWNAITKVEMVRFYSTSYYMYRYVFRVWGNGICIRFDDWIEDLPSLLAILNSNIAKHKIPAFSVDRGRDTLRKATNVAERRKMFRDGVRTPVSEFSCSDNSVSTVSRRPWRF